jgi:glycerol transport system ATP-binding protein
VAGFRPNHLELRKNAPDAIEFTGKLQVTEITGSETFIHLDHHGENWVGLIHGVKNLPIGAALDVYLDPCHIYVFAEDGSSVAPASYASST